MTTVPRFSMTIVTWGLACFAAAGGLAAAMALAPPISAHARRAIRKGLTPDSLLRREGVKNDIETLLLCLGYFRGPMSFAAGERSEQTRSRVPHVAPSRFLTGLQLAASIPPD